MNKYDKLTMSFFLLECVSAMVCCVNSHAVRTFSIIFMVGCVVAIFTLQIKSVIYDKRMFTDMRVREIKERVRNEEEVNRGYRNDYVDRVIPATDIKRE